MNEHLSLPLELKAAGEAGIIAGLASTFGPPADSYGDVVAAGAFARSLDEHKAAGTMPALLWQHDASQPIGKWRSLRETAGGLAVEGKLTLGVQRAKEALALVRDGAINGLSIGFKTRDARRRDGGGRELTDVQLFEVSLVTLPANSGARVTSVRSALAAGALPAKAAFEDALRGIGFSRAQARAVAAAGLDALRSDDDRELLAGIDGCRAVLQRALRGF